MISKETYEQYLDEIGELMEQDELSEREGYWLEEMASQVFKYEEHHYPMDPPTPEEAEAFRKDQESYK